MKLKFDCLADLLAHLDGITPDNHRTRGKWTAAQIFYHLAAAFEGSLNGLPAGYPFLTRWMARCFRWMIIRYWFPPFIPIPSAIRDSLAPPDTCDFLTQKQRLVHAIDAFDSHNQPHPPHPVLGKFTHEQWVGFHLRHCERHLAFIDYLLGS